VSFRLSLSFSFNGHFSGKPGLGGFIDDKAAAIKRAKLQSSHHHHQTNTNVFLQAGCPSCRPTNSVRALKGNNHLTTNYCEIYFSIIPKLLPSLE